MYPVCSTVLTISFIIYQINLKIKNKETTTDGIFTIEEVECLGSCGTAPMMQVNNREYHENLSLDKIDTLLDELKSKHI